MCGAEVEAEALRRTVPTDWEYRYAAVLTWYWEPGTGERHRCQLRPRVQTLAPEEEPEQPARPVQTATELELTGLTSARGFVDD